MHILESTIYLLRKICNYSLLSTNINILFNVLVLEGIQHCFPEVGKRLKSSRTVIAFNSSLVVGFVILSSYSMSSSLYFKCTFRVSVTPGIPKSAKYLVEMYGSIWSENLC